MENAKDLITTMLVRNIPLDSIGMNPNQMRMDFNESELESLAHSIKKHGVLQPILIILKTKELVPTGKGGDNIVHNMYELIAGERRLRAAKMAGLKQIPARIMIPESNCIEIALRENIDRQNLHPIEEGDGYQMLLDHNIYSTHEDISKAFKKSKSRVTECIGFSQLPNEIRIKLFQKGIRDRETLRSLMHKTLKEQINFLENHKDTKKNKDINPGQRESGIHFKYKIGEDSFKMNSFKWKKTQNREDLNKFINSLRKLLQEVEKFVQ